MPISNEQKAEALRRIPLFTGISADSLARLAEVAGEQQFQPGDFVVRQGQVGTGLYVILDGNATVVRGFEDVAQLGPGDFFGELSVIDQMPRVASVRANEALTCLALASWDLIALLDADRALSRNLINGLVARLREVGFQHHH